MRLTRLKGFGSLRARIFWSIIPIVLVLWAFGGVVVLRQQEQLLTDQSIRRGSSMAVNLARSSELGIFAEDRQLLEERLQSVMADPDLAYAFIYGPSGGILVRGGPGLDELPRERWALSDEEMALITSSVGDRSGIAPRQHGGVVEFIVPAISETAASADETLIGPIRGERGDRSAQRAIGVIKLGLSLRAVEDQVLSLIQLWVVVALVVLFLSTVSIYFVSRRISRPVNRLTQQAKTIADGFLDQTIPVETRDEVGELAANFNQMAQALKGNIDAKEKALQELEERGRDLQRSLREVRALGEISRTVTSSLDLTQVLNTVARHAVKLSQSDGCGIFEFDETHRVFDVVVSYKLDKSMLRAIQATPIDRKFAVMDQPIQIADLQSADDFPYRESALEEGFQAALVVPMEGDSVARAAVLFRRRPGDFDERTVNLLATLANQSRVAIDNARLFQEVQDQRAQLADVSRHKSAFLANMSHELRTPMNAILGYTELILDNVYGDVSEKVRGVLERVDKNGRHLLELINDVLDLSKIEAGQLSLALEDYSLQEGVHTVFSSLEPLAAEKNLTLSVKVPPDLPPGRGDLRRINQVLMNLIGNAIKFTDSGEIGVNVAVSNGMFVVSVTDTGPGIPQDDRELIFEEFHQVDSSSTKEKGGTGLGLPITKRIVEMHGGRIWVESTEGKGSTFWFELPVRVEQQREVS